MQTGGPSPTPVQQAPCSPITRRTGRCPNRLQTKVTGSHPQEPLPLHQSVSPADVPDDERDRRKVTVSEPFVNIKVTTNIHGQAAIVSRPKRRWPRILEQPF